MTIRMDNAALYLKGTAEMFVFDISSGDLIGYSNKINTSNLSSSCNNGEIRAGLGAPVVINMPDSCTFSGEVDTADFSLSARQFQTGGTLAYNGKVMVRESVTPSSTTLTVTGNPVAAYGESTDDSIVDCYVGSDGVNYGVDASTKTVSNFVATAGTTYCVTYYVQAASAQELAIPTVFSPRVARVVIKMAVYSAQGSSASNSSLAGYVFVHIPRAQFIGGSAGVDGSQTSASTSSYSFSALAYNDSDSACTTCGGAGGVLGYMVYAPCGDTTSAVQSLVIVGGGVSVKVNETVTVPVMYLMDDGSVVTPTLTDLTYASAATSTATVTNGVITGKAAGNTNVTVTLTRTSGTTLTANCAVTVTAS